MEERAAKKEGNPVYGVYQEAVDVPVGRRWNTRFVILSAMLAALKKALAPPDSCTFESCTSNPFLYEDL